MGKQECKDRAVVQGMRLTKDVPCGDYGDAVAGDLIFLSCNTKWHHMHEFTHAPNNVAPLVGGIVSVEGTCLRQDVRIYKCVESAGCKSNAAECTFSAQWTDVKAPFARFVNLAKRSLYVMP